MHTQKHYNQNGSILVTILVMMIFLTSVLFGLLLLANANLLRARSRIMLLQAQYAAESGADAAIAMLNDTSTDNTTYAGTGSQVKLMHGSQYRATYATTVTTGTNLKQRIIASTGRVFAPASATKPKFIRKIRIIAERSSTTAATSIVSRSIVQTASGVKNVTAKEAYVNDYIELSKNTTNFVFEKVTIGGYKVATGSKCSMTGAGNLVKPPSFSDPAQTKALLRMSFNNCVNPPGNISTSDFDIQPNQSDIQRIVSTTIPWTQYMDSTFQNSVNGCADWTAGSSPYLIPRTGNEKKTHYPDTASGIATSCGTNGNIPLVTDATYTIRDNVHLRANLCKTSACNPIFNNPNPTTKYIFVEGVVNFDSVRSTPGSGPIVIMSYGPDQHTHSCGSAGDAIYLGKSNIETAAPKIYLLAKNGVCLDKTKFGIDPALGGIGGKGIYISTNSGHPWDLHLDPTFPLNEIPLDLTWRQVGYQRIN